MLYPFLWKERAEKLNESIFKQGIPFMLTWKVTHSSLHPRLIWWPCTGTNQLLTPLWELGPDFSAFAKPSNHTDLHWFSTILSGFFVHSLERIHILLHIIYVLFCFFVFQIYWDVLKVTQEWYSVLYRNNMYQEKFLCILIPILMTLFQYIKMCGVSLQL